MVLSLQSSSSIRFPRPFRFQPMWLSNLSFPNVVREAWAPPATLNAAVEKFAVKASAWNKLRFGNIFDRKKRLGAWLKGIQTALSNQPSSFLVNLKNTLRIELAEVSKLKEEF